MRKLSLFLCLILMLASFSGCEKPSAKTADSGYPSPGVEKIRYDDDQVLFMCSDRYDNDNDRSIPYKYNWKGELLDDISYVGYYSENGLAPALDPVSRKVGFINKEGEFIIDPIYSDGGPFSGDGLAAVAVEDESGREKWGFVNTEGKQVVECQYDAVSSFFPSGYAIIVTDDFEHRGIIDKNCHIILEPGDITIGYLYDHYYVGEMEDGMPKIYDYKGNVIEEKLSNLYEIQKSELSDEELMAHFPEIVESAYEEEGIYRYTFGWNENGEIIPQPKLVELFNGKKFVEMKKEYTISSKKVATTKSGKAFGVKKGEETVIPFEYDLLREENGYFLAVKFLDEEGEKQKFDIYNSRYEKTAEDIEYNIYLNQSKFPVGYFEICLDTQFNGEAVKGVVNEKGEVIIEPVFCGEITPCTYMATGIFQ